MRDLIPAVEFLALALGDEAPLVARRVLLSLAALAAAGVLCLVA